MDQGAGTNDAELRPVKDLELSAPALIDAVTV